ncbi:hypothetical protein Syun_027707 [Stephania yunnanensis]|uniref:Negative regulator of systemic acquired resistance SNI1 n=1 Tax=Stephania yunnanensis TaxID=152371 RepID=A0AAP0EG21_9MAGN
MERSRGIKNNNNNSSRGIEENIMAILDASGVKEARDADDDRLAFLEAVRAAFLVVEAGSPPPRKIFEAIFEILRDGTSLELTMASFQLLTELDKHYPNMNLSNSDTSELTGGRGSESIADRETWSPFALGPESAHSEREATSKNSADPIDSSGFSFLIQNIAQAPEEMKCLKYVKKSLVDMLLFKYLVNVLERDFFHRNIIHKETRNWFLLRESLLSMLLGSRRVSYKNLVKDCLSIISRCSHQTDVGLHSIPSLERSSDRVVHDVEVAPAVALLELQKETCVAVQNLFVLNMELDKAKKLAETQGCTSRADGVRTPVIEIIVDELAYNEDLLFPFLQAFSESRWKIEIILQYFWKYLPKPSVRTRRSRNTSVEDETFNAVLRSFSSDSSVRSIIKKISAETAQLLLAHSFQVRDFPLVFSYIKYNPIKNTLTNSRAQVVLITVTDSCGQIRLINSSNYKLQLHCMHEIWLSNIP